MGNEDYTILRIFFYAITLLAVLTLFACSGSSAVSETQVESQAEVSESNNSQQELDSDKPDISGAETEVQAANTDVAEDQESVSSEQISDIDVVDESQAVDQAEKGITEPVSEPDQKGDMALAQQRYPFELTQQLLSDPMSWPPGFDICLNQSGIDMNSLQDARSFPIPMHDAAAMCLLALDIDPSSLMFSESMARGPESDGPPDDDRRLESDERDRPSDEDRRNESDETDRESEDQSMDERQDDIALAVQMYPSNLTHEVLTRRIPWPEGFQMCLSQSIDMDLLRDPDSITGLMHDEASLCLLSLNVAPESLIPSIGDGPQPSEGTQQTQDEGQRYGLSVTKQSTSYSEAIPTSNSSFSTGQDASLWLSGFGFNKSGGPSLFNHPVSVASDGKRLAVTDRNNNRVLIWTSIPSSNVPPDLVIGQPNFETQLEGSGLDGLNFPGQVTMSPDGKVLVADSGNDRILVWTTFPTKSGQAADFEINLDSLIGTQTAWPWGVWTDGEKLAVAVTGGGDKGSKLIFWNSIPTSGSIQPNLNVKYAGMGTPRMIGSNGEYILIGDENGKTECRDGSGTHIWASWPTKTNQAPDACLFGWVGGTIVGDTLIAIQQGGETLAWWDELPRTTEDAADKKRTALPGSGHTWLGGDGNDALYVDGKLFIVEYNGGRVSVFDQLPSGPDQKPDWSLGASSPDVNPYYENWIIQNGVPASNGERLFISSDFDRSLSVWNKIPGESGAIPDLFYRRFENAPWDISVYKDTVFLAGGKGIYGWENFDGTGALPEIEINNNIGSISLSDLRGVAYNGDYFALSSEKDNKVWVWEGIPGENDEPKYELEVPEGPGRLDADSEWLVIAGYPADRFTVKVIRFDELNKGNLRDISGYSSFPQSAALTDIGFFITQQGDNKVLGWDSIEDALAGQSPTVTLGDGQGTKDAKSIKMANAVDWDGSHLWVGEFKFSTRMLAFKPTN